MTDDKRFSFGDPGPLDLTDTIPCRKCTHWRGTHIFLEPATCEREGCGCTGYEPMTADEWEGINA